MVAIMMKSKLNEDREYFTTTDKNRAKYLFEKYYSMYYDIEYAIEGESFTIK